MRPDYLHASAVIYHGYPPEAKAHEERYLARVMGEALIERISSGERAFVIHPINKVEVLGRLGLTLHWSAQIDEITLDERGYTFIGGPAHKQVVKTGGAPVWRIPIMRPVWGDAVDLAWREQQDLKSVKSLVATYNREGIVYMFDRFEEWG